MKAWIGPLSLAMLAPFGTAAAQGECPPRSPDTVVLHVPIAGQRVPFTVREAALMATDAEGLLATCAQAVQKSDLGISSIYASVLQEGRGVLGDADMDRRIAAVRRKGRSGCAEAVQTLRAKPESNVFLKPQAGT